MKNYLTKYTGGKDTTFIKTLLKWFRLQQMEGEVPHMKTISPVMEDLGDKLLLILVLLTTVDDSSFLLFCPTTAEGCSGLGLWFGRHQNTDKSNTDCSCFKDLFPQIRGLQPQGANLTIYPESGKDQVRVPEETAI